MTPKEKQMLDELFQKLRQMEIDSAPRSQEADELLRDYLRQQPAAPYYMAQLLLLQKDALANAKAQIEVLESQIEEQSENQSSNQSSNQSELVHPPQSTEQPTYNRRSFLEGAAQTALGIGGGLLLADFVTGLFDAATGDDGSSDGGSSEANQDEGLSDFALLHVADEADTNGVGGGFGLSDFDLFSYDVGGFL